MGRRLWALLVKEFIQMRRDRVTFGIMVALPVVQLIIFGFAINTEVKHLPTLVLDRSRSAESREMRDAFVATGYFHVLRDVERFSDIEEALQSGTASVGIVFPPDFAPRLRRHQTAPLQVVVDASDSMSAGSAISAAQMLGMVKGQEAMIRRGKSPLTVYDVRLRAWYNPDFVAPFYMVPGTLGIILTMTMIMITSAALVREREQGTMEQLVVTPVRPLELMLGKILPYVIVGYVQLSLGLAVGMGLFDVPVRGSLGLLYLLTLPFIVANLFLGILISGVARTQMQATQMSFFTLLPSILLSGYVFPREAMPEIYFQFSRILPLTYFLRIIRGIMLKGAGWSALGENVLALGVLIGIFATVSLLTFRRQEA